MNTVQHEPSSRPSAATNTEGLPGTLHRLSCAMHDLHDVRRAIDVVRREAASFADDEQRPRSAAGRTRVMRYVDESVLGLLEKVAAVEREIESARECVWASRFDSTVRLASVRREPATMPPRLRDRLEYVHGCLEEAQGRLPGLVGRVVLSADDELGSGIDAASLSAVRSETAGLSTNIEGARLEVGALLSDLEVAGEQAAPIDAAAAE